MPNWCENTLKIQGKSDEIYRFCKKHIVDGRFDFNTIMPEPETEEECLDHFNLNKNPKPYIGPNSDGKLWFNWYDWRLFRWGCKWNSSALSGKNLPDANQGIDEYDDNTCEITFSTPWGPPRNILEELLWDYDEKLKIRIYLRYEGHDEYEFYGETDAYGVKNYERKWHSKPSQILAFLDKRFKIIKNESNAFVFGKEDFDCEMIEDDNFDELTEVVLEKPDCTCNADGGNYNVILADLNQKISGIKNIDHQNAFDLAQEIVYKSMELCSENTNLVFNVATSTPDVERLIRLLKNKFRTVKRIKPPMLSKRSSEVFVVCLKYQINDYDLEGELNTLIE
jgi:23S rRNA U2552 (ribose-2'-O)-methylase RlmE/FtsJ